MFIVNHIYVVFFLSCVVGEYFKNANLESAKYSQSEGWFCRGCTIQQSTDHYDGRYSAKISHRQDGTWSSLSQEVKLPPHSLFTAKIKIKLLNRVPGFMYHNVYFRMYTETSSGHQYTNISRVNFMEAETEWQEIGGVFGGPGYVHLCRFDILIREEKVNFLVDSASLIEVPPLSSHWKDEANQRIDQLRKADIHISLANGVHGHGYSVEIEQKTSEFGFGSMVKTWKWLHKDERAYRKFFLDTFEWTVPESGLKWPNIEPKRGHENFRAMVALDEMRSHGIKVRAHTMFWDNVPDWVVPLKGNDLKHEMEKHMKSCVAHTKGKVEHWDVYNENIHYDSFQQNLNDPNITSWMYTEVHKLDPNVKLFLNEWGVVNSHTYTTAYYDRIKFLKDAGVPVHGIGIQSHLGGADIRSVKERLDLLSRTGLPMWATELRIADTDEHKKADKLEDILRFYFSYPAMEGIMLWGFTPHMSEPKGALVDNSMVPNEAGRRYIKLVRHDWRTHETHSLPTSNSLNVRGFKGDYVLRLKHGNQAIHEKTFTLGSHGAKLQIQGSGSVPHSSTLIG